MLTRARFHSSQGRSSPGVEQLEGRILLSTHVFARLFGSLAAGEVRSFPITLGSPDFTLAGGKTQLGLWARSVSGGALDPAAAEIRNAGGTLIIPKVVNPDLASNRQSLSVVELATGSYTLSLRADRGSTGAFTIDVFLVGDANGDRKVDTADGVLIQGAYGSVVGDARYRIEADANLDNTITALDYSYWRGNQGDVTRLNPLTLTLNLLPAPERLPDGTLQTTTALLNLSGQTAPGAAVALEATDDNRFNEGSTTATTTGTYALAYTLIPGPNTLQVRSRDSFGQQQVATVRVTYQSDRDAPVVEAALANDTAPGGTTNTDGITFDPTISGRVTDAHRVTSFKAGLDATPPGSFVDVLADRGADGRFTFSRARLEQIAGTHLTDGAHTLHLQAADEFGNISSVRDVPFVLDTVTPTVSVTSPLSTLTINHNLTVTGRTADALSGVARLEAQLDGGAFFEVAFQTTTGAFSLTTALPLDASADGSHTVRLRATDVAGHRSDLTTVSFILDTVAPAVPVFNLSSTSRTSDSVEDETAAERVLLLGRTEGDLTVTLQPISTMTLSSHSGAFQFPSVPLEIGDNVLTTRAVDAAGNVSTFTRTIRRVEATMTADVVLDWNRIAREAIRLDASAPPVATRVLAMVHLAMYDAISAVQGTPGYAVQRTAAPGTLAHVAAVVAAHRVLSYVYPAQTAFFDQALMDSLGPPAIGGGYEDSLNLGRDIAESILAQRASDGWNTFVDYVPPTGAGSWQPTPPAYDVALLPQWAALEPFALTSPAQFRPQGPPTLGSQIWTDAFNEVKSLGRADSATRTAEQTQIARFWTDGAGTSTPPGHWNEIAAGVAANHHNSMDENARLFAILNVALADASIAAWDAKYHYGFWRPVTAIRAAESDGNANTTADTTWTPLLVTPPFPEYVSGHSTFSGAAETILTASFGSDVAFITESIGLPGVVRSFPNFRSAAEEAGFSRILGGIHFSFANSAGLATGRSVARQALDRFSVAGDVQPPRVTLTSPSPRLASAVNVTLRGQATDNLSGVATLEVQLDAGTFRPLTFDAEGRFALPTEFALDGSTDGPHIFRFRAVDFRGNVSTLVELPLTLDTRAPAASLTSPTANATLTVGTRLTGSASPTGSTLTSLTYALNSESPIPILFDPTTGAFDEPLDLSRLAPGNHTLTVTARDAVGNIATTTLPVATAVRIPLTVTEHSPLDGADDVGATFRSKVTFSRAIDPSTLDAENFYATDTTGAKLPATIVPSVDGTFAWLFLAAPMPGASTITVTVDGSTIRSLDGAALDAAGTGTPGSRLTFRFSTVSLANLPGTSLSGIVADPGPDLKPMTFDDVRVGPDGVLMTADDIYLYPIEGVKVYLLGQENQAVFTDATGRFHFASAPSGNVKLALDGTTAVNPPTDSYFPEMVLDMTLFPGFANTVMGSMGTREEQTAFATVLGVHLPRLKTSILQMVDGGNVTTIGVDAESAPNLTPEQRAMLTIEIQPGSLIGPDGQPLMAGMVGISTVPPELVREMLPPGVLQHTFDITVQAPGISNFVTPAPMTFPNLFGAAAGTKLNFLSFDHTTGRLEIEGTATVSADGVSVTTDPGTGITHPGWHGLTPPGSTANGRPGQPCIDAQGTVIQGLVAVGEAGDGMYQVLDGVNTLGESVGELFGVAVNTLPSTVSYLFEGFGIADNIATVLNVDDQTPWHERLEAGADLLLTASLFFASVSGAPIGGALATAVALTRIVQSVNSLSDGFENLQSAGQRIVIASQLPPCDPTLSEEATSQAGAIVDGINRLGEKATEQLPLIEELTTLIPSIEDILARGNPDLPFYALSDEELDELNGLFRVYFGIIESIDAHGAFWNEAINVVNSLRIFSSLYTEPRQVRDVPVKSGSLQQNDCALYWSVELGETVLRGRTSDSVPITFFAAPDQLIRVRVYDPVRNEIGSTVIFTGRTGTTTHLGNVPMISLTGFPDTDGDGFPDDAEFVVGTSAVQVDSDRDGIGDFTEVRQCLDPLSGRAVITGIIASVPLRGETKEIIIEGFTLDTQQQTAYIATGSHGLSTVNASQVQMPVVLGQLDLPGDATDVAVDIRLQIAAVATNAGGLQLVNVADPTRPTLIRTISISATQVEVNDGVVYVAVGPELQTYDLPTGEKLQTLPLPGSPITSLAREGSMLYTLDSSNRLHAIDISGVQMTARSSVSLPYGGGKLFVGNGIAYVGVQPFLLPGRGFVSGYVTVNVSDPDNLMVLGSDVNVTLGGNAVVANGSGLVLTVGNDGFGPAVDVMDGSNPSVTTNFLTRSALPVTPNAIAIASGIAFVADGTGGLQVVNYLPFDNRGQAPTVSISSPVIDLDPDTSGIQVIEGQSITIRADVRDDVQIRNVELIVDGQVVQNAVSFPFNLQAIALGSDPNAPRVTVQVRATDTGGNATLSNALVFDLVPDTFAPTILRSSPADNGTVNRGLRRVLVEFSEPLDAATVTEQTFQLKDSSGNILIASDIQLRQDDRVVQLTYEPLDVGTYQLVIKGPAVTDRAGNALGTTAIVRSFTLLDLVVYVADPNALGGTGGIIRVDPNTGVQTIVASGGNLNDPVRILVTANGDLFVSNPTPTAAQILRINASTGAQTVVSSGGLLFGICSIVIATNGDLYVADNGGAGAGGLIRVNPTTGAQTLVSSGGNFYNPCGLAIAANGDLYISDDHFFDGDKVTRVNPITGAQTVVYSATPNDGFTSLALAANGDIFVTNARIFGGSPGILRIDPTTGSHVIVTQGGYFVAPSDIAIDANGDLLVTDQNAFDGNGGLIRVDPETGFQTVISSGGNLMDPTGIAILGGTNGLLPLKAIGQAPVGGENSERSQHLPAVLMLDQVASLLREAQARWSASGLAPELPDKLSQVTVRTAALNGSLLGLTSANNIWIDADAAGHGWFVDPTPATDEEFQEILSQHEYRALGNGPAASRIDLLTVLMHELGHVLGLDHSDDHDVMAESLEPGVRRLPLTAQEDEVDFPSPTTSEPGLVVRSRRDFALLDAATVDFLMAPLDGRKVLLDLGGPPPAQDSSTALPDPAAIPQKPALKPRFPTAESVLLELFAPIDDEDSAVRRLVSNRTGLAERREMSSCLKWSCERGTD